MQIPNQSIQIIEVLRPAPGQVQAAVNSLLFSIMIGIVLCGGQSSRMGSDKGLLKTQEDTWAKIAAGKIEALNIPVFLSVNHAQYNGYAGIFDAAQLIKDNELIDVKGPLKGVLSAHLQHPAQDLYILACDMPLMETVILQQLYGSFQSDAAEAWVFSNDNALEPLCGIYTAGGLAKIMQLLRTQGLQKHSMKYVLEQLHTEAIPVLPDQKKYFLNVNAHAQLNGL